MAWHKLGLLFSPVGERHSKLLTHAANPLPLQLDGDVFRVFFSGRDASNRSSVGAVDIDIVKRHVMQEHFEPIFEYGPPGSFYSDGVSIGNCYDTPDGKYMLFMGWQNPEDGHWRGEIGRLRVGADLSLSLDGHVPFIPLNAEDPVSLSYPWVMPEPFGGGYAMWYGSTLAWDAGNGEMLHVIKRASSLDGEIWQREGLSVPYGVGVAQAFSRPSVVRDSTGLHMWFSYRSGTGQTYRIGYASSVDGGNWELPTKAPGIDVSIDGWDSEMIEYPYVFEHRGERYMLYNGNGYGKTGFGLAIRAEDV